MERFEIESYKKAGEISKQIKTFACEFIKPGMKLIDIAENIDKKIFELGGKPAFPVNLSLNEIAAHFTPAKGDNITAEGLLKVDVGVAVDEFIADTALSIDLTPDKRFSAASGIPSKKGTGVPSSSGMIELNKKMLDNATSAIKAGVEIREIGEACQETLEKWNEENKTSFSIIKGLSGHSLAKGNIHAGLTISNYRNDNKNVLNDIAFAVEPFVTSGDGDIYEGQPGGIYVVQNDGQVRDRDARELLKFIKEKFGTLPFCVRWLEDEGLRKLKFGLSLLVKQGILYEYPMLIEKSKAPVSQFENTFIISDGKVVRTTE